MTASFSLAQFLPYQLAYIAERVSRRLAVEYGRSHGLSVAEWRVLVNLQHLGTSSVRDIQIFTNLEKSRVSRAVVRLEAAGLVKKQKSTEDARLVEIAITAEGVEALAAIIPAAVGIEERLLNSLDADKMRAFFDVIEHFHCVLDADPDARARYERQDQEPQAAPET